MKTFPKNFWWGAATTDKETYRALFQYTQDYLASTKNMQMSSIITLKLNPKNFTIMLDQM